MFADPFWPYHPREAAGRIGVEVSIGNEVIEVSDDAGLPPLLVTNLLAPARPDPIRYLGLARTVMAGSEPVNGEDPVSRLLDVVTPA